MGTRKRSRRRATAAGVSFETLERTPERAFRFLIGLSRNPIALRALGRHGFGDADRRAGIALLDRVLSFEHAGDEAEDVTAAIETLDDWDERGIELIRLALTRYPEVRDQLLADVTSSTGTDAVLGVRRLLDRLDAFDARPDAAEAMAHLRSRGFGPEERARLRALVETAQSIDTSTPLDGEADYERTLLELKTWYDEWTGFARLAIPRRDVLLRLGLARPSRDDDED